MAGRIAYLGGIVTQGLVLALDAAKRDSYPGTGTAWNDISGNRNNGTLINGPTFNSDNGGSIVFDGTNDRLTTTYTTSTLNNVSFEIWYKWNGVVAYNPLLYIGNINQNGYGLVLSNGSSGTGNRIAIAMANVAYNILSSSVTLNSSSWNHLVVTRDTTTISLYNNGSFFASSTSNPIVGANMAIGYPDSSNSYTGAGGNLSIMRFYTKCLTSSEVLQNYNATKNRYI